MEAESTRSTLSLSRKLNLPSVYPPESISLCLKRKRGAARTRQASRRVKPKTQLKVLVRPRPDLRSTGVDLPVQVRLLPRLHRLLLPPAHLKDLASFTDTLNPRCHHPPSNLPFPFFFCFVAVTAFISIPHCPSILPSYIHCLASFLDISLRTYLVAAT
jgi:hypothetical protein